MQGFDLMLAQSGVSRQVDTPPNHTGGAPVASACEDDSSTHVGPATRPSVRVQSLRMSPQSPPLYLSYVRVREGAWPHPYSHDC